MKFIYWPVWAVFAYIGFKVLMYLRPETIEAGSKWATTWTGASFLIAGTFAGFMTIAAEAQVDKRIAELIDQRLAAREKSQA